jgi:hypothetical protein
VTTVKKNPSLVSVRPITDSSLAKLAIPRSFSVVGRRARPSKEASVCYCWPAGRLLYANAVVAKLALDLSRQKKETRIWRGKSGNKEKRRTTPLHSPSCLLFLKPSLPSINPSYRSSLYASLSFNRTITIECCRNENEHPVPSEPTGVEWTVEALP